MEVHLWLAPEGDEVRPAPVPGECREGRGCKRRAKVKPAAVFGETSCEARLGLGPFNAALHCTASSARACATHTQAHMSHTQAHMSTHTHTPHRHTQTHGIQTSRRTFALTLPYPPVRAQDSFSPYWGEYNTSSAPVDGKLNVHIVPHTQSVGLSLRLHQPPLPQLTSVQKN